MAQERFIWDSHCALYRRSAGWKLQPWWHAGLQLAAPSDPHYDAAIMITIARNNRDQKLQ